jgi:hypothetical protein
MSSWNLFRYLTPFWEPPIADPIFAREQTCPPIWRRVTPWMARAAKPALLAFVGVYGLALLLAPTPVNTLCVFSAAYLLFPLFALAPSLLFWMLPLGLTLGPIIVREREGGTWDTLRTTPLDTRLIVLSKAQGAVWPLRGLMAVIRNFLIIVAFGVGAFGLIVMARAVFGAASILPAEIVCVIGLAVAAAGAIVFLADWAQQFVLMGVSAIAVSAAAPSQRIAVASAIVAAFIAWMVNAGVAWLVLLALPGHALSQPTSALPTLTILGPPVTYILALSPGEAAASIVLTLILREIVIRAIWRLALRAATDR